MRSKSDAAHALNGARFSLSICRKFVHYFAARPGFRTPVRRVLVTRRSRWSPNDQAFILDSNEEEKEKKGVPCGDIVHSVRGRAGGDSFREGRQQWSSRVKWRSLVFSACWRQHYSSRGSRSMRTALLCPPNLLATSPPISPSPHLEAAELVENGGNMGKRDALGGKRGKTRENETLYVTYLSANVSDVIMQQRRPLFGKGI